MTDKATPPKRARIYSVAVKALHYCVAITTVAFAVLGFLLAANFTNWRLETARNFEPLYLLISLLCAFTATVLKRKGSAAFATLLTIYHASFVLPVYFARPPAHLQAPRLRVMTANMKWANSSPDAFVQAVRQTNPDILAVQEVSWENFEHLRQLLDQLPFHTEHVRANALGVALFSRYPITNPRIFWLTDHVYATIAARVAWNGSQIDLLVVHALSPSSAIWTARRNAQLAAIPEAIRPSQNACIVLGDLNATMWTPELAQMKELAGLRDARKGHGIFATYPAVFPLVPIDQCLYRGELHAVSCEQGPQTGSDHLPLIVEFVQTRTPN